MDGSFQSKREQVFKFLAGIFLLVLFAYIYFHLSVSVTNKKIKNSEEIINKKNAELEIMKQST
jgi:hypothetical protein